jgi:hypothetical protein
MSFGGAVNNTLARVKNGPQAGVGANLADFPVVQNTPLWA